MPKRCEWCTDDPLYIAYHDEEWGVPLYDDKALFAMLQLEGMQAGLSWITVLRKREAMYDAFANFEPERLVRFNKRDMARCMKNPEIIRNRLKIESVVKNARAYLDLREQDIRFSDYVWQFVDGKPIVNRWRRLQDIPTQTDESLVMSKTLKKAGFKFVGPTICYAFMQAVGMVDDHVVGCFRKKR